MGALDDLLGIKTIIDGTGPSDVVLTPMRKALRFIGAGFVVEAVDDAINVMLTGEGGAKGADGDKGPDGDQGPVGSLATIGRLDTTHSPKVLWSLNKTLNDTSGLAHHATVAAGTLTYTELWPGYFGASFQSLRLSLAHADVQIVGDLTVECVLMLDAAPNGSFFLTHAASGETSATNCLYGLALLSSRLFTAFWENGSGSNVSWFSDTVAAPAPGVPFHFAYTRISNVHRVYFNGVLAGTASGTLAAPTGGASGSLLVGGDEVGNFAPSFCMADLKILDVGLDATQVLAEAEKTIGQLY